MALATTTIGLLGVGASLAGSAIQAGAAGRAADAQRDAADRQIDLARETRDLTRGDLQPYVQGGNAGQAAYLYEMGLGERPTDYAGFSMTPGQQFQLQQGLGAVQGSAAMRGNLLSGSTMSALQRTGQGIAAQGYDTHMNRLAGLGQSGQNAAAGLGAANTNYAQMGANALANMGNAQAAGAIGQANAWAGGLNNAIGAIGYMNAAQPAQTGQPRRATALSSPWGAGGFWG